MSVNVVVLDDAPADHIFREWSVRPAPARKGKRVCVWCVGIQMEIRINVKHKAGSVGHAMLASCGRATFLFIFHAVTITAS